MGRTICGLGNAWEGSVLTEGAADLCYPEQSVLFVSSFSVSSRHFGKGEQMVHAINMGGAMCHVGM